MTGHDDITGRLWGGRLETTWFDPGGGVAVLVVSTQREDEIQRFRIDADAVREFRFLTDGGGRPWFYAEVTQVHLDDRRPDGMTELILLLWSEDHTITIRAASIRITEQPGQRLTSGL
jgi:hypothetical protein